METKRTNGRSLALACAVALCLAGRATAQDGEAPGKEPQELVPWLDRTEGAPELLAAIAAVRVAMDVDGDLEAASSQLVALSLKACSFEGFEGQTEVLVQAALARAELQQLIGDLAKAAEELRRVLPAQPFRVRTVGGFHQGPPSQRLLTAVGAARKDARIVEALSRLERAAGATTQAGTVSLDELVDGLFDERDYGEIVAIGFAAFERFAARVLETVPEFQSDLSDEPLLYLVTLDERRSARFLAQNLTAGGPFWRQRILRVMQERDVLENDGTWTSSRPFVCLEPEWLELIEELLAARETASTALPLFASVERRDALTPGLCAAFARALAAHGPDYATQAMQAFDHEGVVASAQPALEAALGLADVRLRRFAAEKLVNFARSEALLARATDPDVEVRRQVVSALGGRRGWYFVYRAPLEHRDLGGPVETRDQATLRTLLVDEEAGIRAPAARLLDRLEEPLEEEAYLRLCSDPAAEVRAALVSVSRIPPDLRGRLLARLARDPAQQVVQTLDNVLRSDFEMSGPISTDVGPYLEALEARWNDAARPLTSTLRQGMEHILLGSPAGTRALVGWMLAAPERADWKVLDAKGKSQHLLTLSDEFLARLLGSCEPDTLQHLWRRLLSSQDDRVQRPAAMRLLMVDTAAPLSARLRAAQNGATDTAAYRQACLDLLRVPVWATAEEEDLQLLRSVGRGLEPASRNVLALAVLQDDAIRPEVADEYVSSYAPEAEGGPALAEAILARWLKPGEPYRSSVEATLYGLVHGPGVAQRERLERALPLYSDAVVTIAQERSDPELLPLLERAMKAEWLPANQRDELQKSVAYALGAFDDDRAVALLLGGLRSNNDQVRAACEESLGRIKAYRDQVSTWAGRERPAPTRASALGELLTLLGDADPALRKEAARGLGTLGASEALPDLIRALKDADAGVRAAAQAAIERLSAAADPRAKDSPPAGG